MSYFRQPLSGLGLTEAEQADLDALNARQDTLQWESRDTPDATPQPDATSTPSSPEASAKKSSGGTSPIVTVLLIGAAGYLAYTLWRKS